MLIFDPVSPGESRVPYKMLGLFTEFSNRPRKNLINENMRRIADSIDNLDDMITTTSFDSPVYTCPSAVSVGDAVYISGSNSVDKADANDVSTFPVIGFVSQKPTTTQATTQAILRYFGELDVFSGLSPGVTYYLSETPGQISSVAPTAGGSVVQRVGFPRSATTLVIVLDGNFITL